MQHHREAVAVSPAASQEIAERLVRRREEAVVRVAALRDGHQLRHSGEGLLDITRGLRERFLDERTVACQQREALAGRFDQVPCRPREELREHRHEIGQDSKRVIARCTRCLSRELLLAVAHGAPELDALQRDACSLRPHGWHRDLLITVQSGGGEKGERQGGSGKKCGRKRGRGEETNASGGRGGEVKDVNVDEE